MILKDGIVLTQDVLRKASVVLNDGFIADITDRDYASVSNDGIIDCSGLYVFPGFVDSHIHGSGGGDSCNLTDESYINIVKSKAMQGTTAIVLALGGMSDAFVHKSVQLIRKTNSCNVGSTILGLHLEGPWVSSKKLGAIPKGNIAERGEMDRAMSLVSGYESDIKIITLAPEIEGIESIIRYLVNNGIVVSLGHSDGTYNDASKAVASGATCFTHVFNAVNPISGREPGLVGCAISHDDCFCEIIADGYHVHPANIKMISRIKKNKTIAMTDSIEVTGTACTTFELPGIGDVEVRDGRTWGPNGIIMGSVLTQDQALRNLLSWGTCGIIEAVKMLSENPCKLLGLYPQKGCLSPGNDADITILDKDFNVVFTIIKGKIVYRKR